MPASLRPDLIPRHQALHHVPRSDLSCLQGDDDAAADNEERPGDDPSADDPSADADSSDADEALFDPDQGDLLGDFGLDADESQPEYGDFDLDSFDLQAGDEDDDWRAFD